MGLAVDLAAEALESSLQGARAGGTTGQRVREWPPAPSCPSFSKEETPCTFRPTPQGKGLLIRDWLAPVLTACCQALARYRSPWAKGEQGQIMETECAITARGHNCANRGTDKRVARSVL